MKNECQPRQVLIIDNEPIVCKFLSRFLEKEGVQSDVAENGLQGLECMRHKTYDLVFCDIEMEEMDGLEFYRVLKEQYPHLQKRVVFTSGDKSGYDRLLQENQEAQPYLTKPLSISQLRDLLRSLLYLEF